MLPVAAEFNRYASFSSSLTDMDFNSPLQEYLVSRCAFRQKAKNDFLDHHELSDELINRSGNLVSGLALFCSGKNMSHIDNPSYVSGLIVSFCRSHFASVDLMLIGEYIESATLTRKNIELMGRMYELNEGVDKGDLVGSTPNIKDIPENVRRLYSAYSEIAHSASPSTLDLLGYRQEDKGFFHVLYPEFQEDGYVLFNHVMLVAMNYCVWAIQFYSDIFKDFDGEEYYRQLSTLIDTHIEVFPKEYDS